MVPLHWLPLLFRMLSLAPVTGLSPGSYPTSQPHYKDLGAHEMLKSVSRENSQRQEEPERQE